MKFGFVAIMLVSMISLSACTKTEFEFGQSNKTAVMHDSMGNVRENMQLEPLAPISENKETPIMESPATQIVQPKLPKIQPTPKSTISRKNEEQVPFKQDQPPINPINLQDDWHPNEALIIRGSELLIGLQKELGTKPDDLQKQQRLQSHMGLTSSQATKLILEIGA